MRLRDFAERDRRPIEALVYKRVDGQNLRLLVCKPAGWAAGQKRPALVWIHGGGWVSGAPEGFSPHMRYSAARGAVGFGVQYRLLKPAGYRNDKQKTDEENRIARQARLQAFIDGPSLSDCIADAMDGIRYIRTHADELGIDPGRITAIGDSSGAHLAGCLGTLAVGDARAKAVIACSAVTDLTSGFGINSVKPSKGFDYAKPADDGDRMARARQVSPMHNVKATDTAFLILHGDGDWIKPERPRAFCAALKKAGVDCEFKLYEGARHAFIVYGYSATLEETTRAILDLDAFLVKRGLLDGPTSIKMPAYQEERKVIASIAGPFTGKKVIRQDGDFPGFLTISLKVKPAKRFSGKLFEMPGVYGCSWRVSNGGHDFGARRLRQRGKQIGLKPELWQEVRVSMGRDKVVIRVGEQVTEIPNEVGHAFVSDEIVFGDGLDAEIKNVEVHGYAM
jgi:acetyl esterase/lipase